MSKSSSTPKFEDKIEEIDREILKRKSKWKLSVLSWMDYDDVSQIIRIHIFKKWDMYDPAKPLGPWLNRIISNQIKNLIRNNYGNYCRPCLKCAAAQSYDLCAIYEKQGAPCPLYVNWIKGKKNAHDTKLPVSIENHQNEVKSLFSEEQLDVSINNLNEALRKVLKPIEWKVYEHLYINFKTEEELAKKLNFKTNEKNRTPGYKQINNIVKKIIEKSKKILAEGGLDF
jgi:RNA polymerase sigma factor (sigma-70 family)